MLRRLWRWELPLQTGPSYELQPAEPPNRSAFTLSVMNVFSTSGLSCRNSRTHTVPSDSSAGPDRDVGAGKMIEVSTLVMREVSRRGAASGNQEHGCRQSTGNIVCESYSLPLLFIEQDPVPDRNEETPAVIRLSSRFGDSA